MIDDKITNLKEVLISLENPKYIQNHTLKSDYIFTILRKQNK